MLLDEETKAAVEEHVRPLLEEWIGIGQTDSLVENDIFGIRSYQDGFRYV